MTREPVKNPDELADAALRERLREYQNSDFGDDGREFFFVPVEAAIAFVKAELSRAGGERAAALEAGIHSALEVVGEKPATRWEALICHRLRSALADAGACCAAKLLSAKPWIVSKPGVMGGKPCVRGTRITVETLQAVNHEWTTLEILEQYPGLTSEGLAAALAYKLPAKKGAKRP
jgi:uncharacterized protein (DUF433 family)